jgi:hypothetical protein
MNKSLKHEPDMLATCLLAGWKIGIAAAKT